MPERAGGLAWRESTLTVPAIQRGVHDGHANPAMRFMPLLFGIDSSR